MLDNKRLKKFIQEEVKKLQQIDLLKEEKNKIEMKLSILKESESDLNSDRNILKVGDKAHMSTNGEEVTIKKFDKPNDEQFVDLSKNNNPELLVMVKNEKYLYPEREIFLKDLAEYDK